MQNIAYNPNPNIYIHLKDMETIPLIEVKKKLSTQIERINFAREQRYYLPKMVAFDSKFICQWLSGKKKYNIIYIILLKLLALGFVGGFELPYFTKKSTKKNRYTR